MTHFEQILRLALPLTVAFAAACGEDREVSSPLDAVEADLQSSDLSNQTVAEDANGAPADAAPLRQPYAGPTCATNAVCKAQVPLTPYCQPTVKQCVECLFDGSCPKGQNCQNYTCQEVHCTPGAQSCQNNDLLTCNDDGQSYQLASCPIKQPLCIAGSCRLCKPDSLFCGKSGPYAETSDAVFECSSDGLGKKLKNQCQKPMFCLNAACVVCAPGTLMCDGEHSVKCRPDSSGYDLVLDCTADDNVCLAGVCVKAPVVIYPDGFAKPDAKIDPMSLPGAPTWTELASPAVGICPTSAAPWPKLVPAPAPTALVVHEWGTFTSVQDSAGVTLDGMHHDEEPLPSFVHALPGKLGFELECPDNVRSACGGLQQEPNQKMETPVLYFHSPTAGSVEVKVDFPKGLITQWYPDSKAFLPDPTQSSWQVEGGSMTWSVQFDPKGDSALWPKVPIDSVWAPSRQTAAAPIQTKGKVGSENEGFIFYRGLGRVTLPLTVQATDQALALHNDSLQQVKFALVLRTWPDGTGEVSQFKAIEAGALQSVALPILGCKGHVDIAANLLRNALMDAGLYDDEARALLNTWRQSYFKVPGLRVLYILPRPWTDEMLPITLKPEPQKLERVLVGRIEVLTPAIEDATLQLTNAWTKKWQAGETIVNGAALVKLDRMMEARVRQTLALPGLTKAFKKVVKTWLLQMDDGVIVQ